MVIVFIGWVVLREPAAVQFVKTGSVPVSDVEVGPPSPGDLGAS